MVTMSRLNRDFQWAIRDKQSLLRARFLYLIMIGYTFTPWVGYFTSPGVDTHQTAY